MAAVLRALCFEKLSGKNRFSGPISRDIAILSLRYPIPRDTFEERLAIPQNVAIPPPWYLVSHRHICAIPRIATYRAIIVRYSIKASTKEFCDTFAARYEKYRCWASKKTGRCRTQSRRDSKRLIFKTSILWQTFSRAKLQRQILISRVEVRAEIGRRIGQNVSEHFRASLAVQSDPPSFSLSFSQFITPCLVAAKSKFHLRELLGLGGPRAFPEACPLAGTPHTLIF